MQALAQLLHLGAVVPALVLDLRAALGLARLHAQLDALQRHLAERPRVRTGR